MTKIDWEKPCETCEDPPRPVRVLATDLNPPSPVAVAIGRDLVSYKKDGTEGINPGPLRWPALRNVPEPKPGSVRHEGYVAIFPSYYHDFGKVVSGPICMDMDAFSDCIQPLIIGRIVWNSDGSPVGDETTKSTGCVHLDIGTCNGGAIAERDILKAEVGRLDALTTKQQALQASMDMQARMISRMRQVVEAAVAYVNTPNLTAAKQALYLPLYEACRAYADARTEKSCKTCDRLIREEGTCNLYGISRCLDFDKWEPRR